MIYIYHIYGENRYCDYENKQIQIKKNNNSNSHTRVYPFELLINQTTFSIQTLRLFDKENKIIILTNQPTHPKLIPVLELKNIEIIDMSAEYEKEKHNRLWYILLGIEGLIKYVNDDFIFIDCDTFFFKTIPKFSELFKENQIIVDKNMRMPFPKRYNIGIFGMTKNNKNKYIQQIYEKILLLRIQLPEERVIDEIAINKIIQKNNFQIFETNKFIRHYYNDLSTKNNNLTFYQQIFEKIKKDNNL